MDNITTVIFGIGLFVAFIGGLAESIGKVPFIIIVIGVAGMALYDLYENMREARNADKT